MFDKRFGFFIQCSILITFVSAYQTNSNSNYGYYPAGENGTCYKRVLYDDATAANISAGNFKTLPGVDLDDIKLGRDKITIIDCCPGFLRDEDTGKCETHCDEGCFGGTCTGPNECTCENGYRAEAGICKAVCRRRCARNAYCFTPDVCTCKFGFEEIEGSCQPVCRHGCPNGSCVAPQDCRCHPGYFLNETKHCEPVCEGGCPHGICVSPGVCSCDEGYGNPRNSVETCVPDCPNNCINGQCLSPNKCTCFPGYDIASDGSCSPRCEDECVDGYCAAPNKCVCNVGYILSSSTKTCIEKPRDYVKPGEYPQQNNGPYGSNFRPSTVSTVGPYDRTTERYPQFTTTPSRFNNNDNFNVRPIDKNQRPTDQQHSYDPASRYRPYGQGQTRNPPGTYTSTLWANNQNINQNRPEDKTPRPQGHYPTLGPNSEGNRNQHDDHGRDEPKLFYPENPHDQTQNSINHNLGPSYTSTQDPRVVVGNRNNYESSQTNRPQGPFPPQGSYPRPELTTTPSSRGGAYENGQTQRPQGGGPFPPSTSSQDHYANRPYSQNQNHHPQQGIKNPYHRPNTDQYPRPAQTPKDQGLELVYGINIVHDPPENRGAILTLGPNQPHDPSRHHNHHHNQAVNGNVPQQPQIQQPTDLWNIGGNDGVARTYLLEDGQISIIDPLGPVCTIPCINGVCIGPNLCACSPGYGPDPTNRFSNMCLPMCHGGCINGVCTAPNVCICNVGYTKQHGIKGSNRCVPAE